MFIDEDYVSFEISKLLDEKQFAGDYSHCYSLIKESGWYGDIKYDVSEGSIYNSKAIYIKESIPAPTLQTAMKWLRKIHKLHIEVYRTACGYQYIISNIPYGTDLKCSEREGDDEMSGQFTTYEKTVEAAIKDCLTNLI